jgi:hypothetical protein
MGKSWSKQNFLLQSKQVPRAFVASRWVPGGSGFDDESPLSGIKALSLPQVHLQKDVAAILPEISCWKLHEG